MFYFIYIYILQCKFCIQDWKYPVAFNICLFLNQMCSISFYNPFAPSLRLKN